MFQGQSLAHVRSRRPRRHAFVTMSDTGTWAAETWLDGLRQRVLGAGTALRRREAAALGGDRTALHTVRRRYVDTSLGCFVDLRRAHPLPEQRDVLRHFPLEHDVARLIVTRLVAGREDRRELVERELPVRRRIALPPVRADQVDVGVALERQIAPREAPLRRGPRAGQRAAEDQAAPECGAHVAHLLQVLPDEALPQRLVVPRERTRS